MKETHKYVGIGTVVGLLVGQLLVAVTHFSSKTGEDVNLLIPAAKMDKEKLKVDDAVFLGKSKKSEQNGNG